MKILQISSVPMMELIQKACENLVVANTEKLNQDDASVIDRLILFNEIEKANELIDHLCDLIKENKSDSSNPKS